jgi:RNA polymerase sigma-70 factor (ECF subfamily)
MPTPRQDQEVSFTGDRGAVSAIYDRDFTYVWQGLRRLGIPLRDLPDVTHDVFFTVFRNLGKFDDSRPFRPWLFGVMFRVASDHIRLARNAREVLYEGPEVADPGPGPDTACAHREEWRIVDRVLAALDVRHRAVLVMHDFSGHKAWEVARELDLPVKTVFSRLRTARRRFVLLATESRFPPAILATLAKDCRRSGTKA